MARRSTRNIRHDRTNYTSLLQELQEHKASEPAAKAAPARPPAPAAPPISDFRQRLMSDESIHYFYKTGDKIHDKTCRAARWIPDEELRWSGSYHPDLAQCPDCQLKAYLRLGARDVSRAAAYEKLFETMGFSAKLLRRMYVHEGIQTEIIGPGRLKLWGNEDTWLLETLAGQKALRLMHNNYHALPDGSRRFVSGFHEQAAPTTAQHAVSVIAGYTYEKHKAALAQRDNMACASKPPLAPAQPQPNIWRRIWSWLHTLLGKRR